MTKPVYLDYNATTPVDPAVFKEMTPYFNVKFGNPSSRHTFGFEAESAVKFARKRIAELINASEDEVYFTSGATESINIVHMGVAKAYSGQGRNIVTSVIEHPAVSDSLKFLEENGFRIIHLPVDNEGLLNMTKLSESISKDTILVSLMAANNEIGVLNDVYTIGEICRERNVLFHSDASQAMGKIPLDVQKINIDFLSFSGHKFYAPKGIGGLYIRKKLPGIKIAPILFGGGQEKGLRPGTLNVPGIVGIGKAAEICTTIIHEEHNRVCKLRDRFLEELRSNIDDVILNGSKERRLPNNLNISFKGVRAANLMMELRDIAFSSGSACASESDRPSPVLKAIGLTDEEALCSVRFGFGRFTAEEEVDYAINRLTKAVDKIRNYKQNKVINERK